MALQLLNTEDCLAKAMGAFSMRGSNAHDIPNLEINTFYGCPSGTTFILVHAGNCVTYPLASETERALNDLHSVVEHVQVGQLFAPMSQGFEELLTQALQQRGTPENVDTWARTLADDVGDLTD